MYPMKRGIIIYLIVLSVLLMSLLLPACAAPAPTTPTPTSPAPTPQPVVTKVLKFSYTTPKGIGAGKGWEWFAEEFTKRSNGRYKVETYPANTLMATDSIMDGVKTGIAEISNTSTGLFSKHFVYNSVTELPALGFPHTADGIKQGAKAWWEMYDSMPEIRDEFKDYHLIWTVLPAPQVLVSKKKEIRLPTDLKGLRIGSGGPAQRTLAEACGGVAVQQVPPDSF